MKKLLIATTALVGTAGVVAADVTFSGYGRFGILYQEDNSRTATAADVAATSGSSNPLAVGDEIDLDDTRLESRYRLNIDASTETDGGVRFAARIRIQADDNADGTAQSGEVNGARFQVSAGGFRVRVGNVSGVHDAAETVNFFGFEPGLIGQTGHYATFGGGPIDAYSARGAGVNGLNVKYEIADFTVMASYSEDFDDEAGTFGAAADYEAFEIGASYAIAGWTFAAGYGTADSGTVVDATGAEIPNAGFDNEFWTLTATGAIGPADVAFFVGDSDIDGDDTAYGISGAFPIGASTTIEASYAGGGNDDLDDTYGIGFDHSLGGGVTLTGMVGESNTGNTIADLGVIFNF